MEPAALTGPIATTQPTGTADARAELAVVTLDRAADRTCVRADRLVSLITTW